MYAEDEDEDAVLDLEVLDGACTESVTFTGWGNIGVFNKAIPFLIENFEFIYFDPPGWPGPSGPLDPPGLSGPLDPPGLICSVLLLPVKGEIPDRWAAFRNNSLGATGGCSGN